jgi:hypothetical protein
VARACSKGCGAAAGSTCRRR